MLLEFGNNVHIISMSVRHRKSGKFNPSQIKLKTGHTACGLSYKSIQAFEPLKLNFHNKISKRLHQNNNLSEILSEIGMLLLLGDYFSNFYGSHIFTSKEDIHATQENLKSLILFKPSENTQVKHVVPSSKIYK